MIEGYVQVNTKNNQVEKWNQDINELLIATEVQMSNKQHSKR